MHAYQSILLITNNPLADVKKYFDIDGAHPDIDTLVVVPETTIGIETIRNLKSFTSRRPLKTTTKQVLILEAQLLTPESQNALLKLLEEPPSYVTVILTAPHTHAFLETVLSRCQIIRADSIKADTSIASPVLTPLLALSAPERLKTIPLDTKMRPNAVNFCQQLISEAQASLHQSPTSIHLTNLQILTECLSRLVANANPTLCLTDAILRLQAETSLATMTQLPEKNR